MSLMEINLNNLYIYSLFTVLLSDKAFLVNCALLTARRLMPVLVTLIYTLLVVFLMKTKFTGTLVPHTELLWLGSR